MKVFATALLCATAYSATTTDNNCLMEQGTEYVENCRSLWYKICDTYNIGPEETCNVETFGDAAINWFSDSIDVFYWNYVMKFPDEEAESSPNSEQWTLRQSDDEPLKRHCLPQSLGSSTYSSEKPLNTRTGDCGFKFQIINNSEKGGFDFTVLRNGAQSVAAGLTIATAATLALF